MNELEHFKKWRKQKLNDHKVLSEKELINFIYEKRIADFHHGVSTLAYTMNGHHFSSDNLGRKPSSNAQWLMNAKGVFWLVGKGTSEEKLIPCEINEAFAFNVSIINPPAMHMHKAILSTDPISICRIALNYYEELLFEAKNKFGD